MNSNNPYYGPFEDRSIEAHSTGSQAPTAMTAGAKRAAVLMSAGPWEFPVQRKDPRSRAASDAAGQDAEK
jgi:hypothetical protein